MALRLIPYYEPTSFKLGPLTFSIFGLLAAAGVYLGARLTARAASKRGLDPKPLLDFAVWGVLSGVVFGHLVHLLLYHPEELQSPLGIFKVWEGLSSFGGLLGGIVAAVVFFRHRGIRFHDYSDALALGVAPGWGVARLGCFAIHDHPGVVTHFPLAVAFTVKTATGEIVVPRHDLGLYDALWLFGIAAILYVLAHRHALEGRLLGLLALLYAIGRFYFDTLRARPGDVPYADARYFGLTPAQYACFLLVAYAVWQFWTKRAGSQASEAKPAGAEGRSRSAR